MSRRGRRSSAKLKNRKGRRKADKSLKFKMNVGKNRTSDVVLCNNVVSDGAEQCAEEMPRKWRNTSAKQKNRNNRSRAEKIMKKKTLRRIRKNGKNCTIVSAIHAISDDAAQNATAINTNKNNTPENEQPTTSRNRNKHASPHMKPRKSPYKRTEDGKRVYRFKKLKDDQARKLVRRSVSIMTDNHNNKSQTSPNGNKMLPNRCLRKSKDTISVNTLEEGEIRSEDETIVEIKYKNNEDDDDDDCILVEPNVDEIVINDVDDDNDENPSTSIMSSTYQSLIKSFNHRSTSTPYHKNTNNIVNRQLHSPAHANRSADKITSEEAPLFFEDVVGWPGTETINSTDNFTDYTKLTTIRDKFRIRKRSVRLKEKSSAEEIIDLDDLNCSINSTMKPINSKRKSCELDDSVIFISEINKNDFIPLTDDASSEIPKTKVPKIQDNPCTPPNRVCLNNLYTKSETKQLAAYNENAYNPSAGQELASGKRMVLIDGSNVAFKHSCDKNFSVKGLTIAINYFEKMGHEVKAVIPQFRMNKNKSSDYEELERLHKNGKIVQTPCKNLPGLTSTSYDDRFILQLAFELDTAIVSNDNYRDLLHENPSFKKIIENRVIGYTWCNDIFILPKDPYGKWGPTLHSILNR